MLDTSDGWIVEMDGVALSMVEIGAATSHQQKKTLLLIPKWDPAIGLCLVAPLPNGECGWGKNKSKLHLGVTLEESNPSLLVPVENSRTV